MWTWDESTAYAEPSSPESEFTEMIRLADRSGQGQEDFAQAVLPNMNACRSQRRRSQRTMHEYRSMGNGSLMSQTNGADFNRRCPLNV